MSRDINKFFIAQRKRLLERVSSAQEKVETFDSFLAMDPEAQYRHYIKLMSKKLYDIQYEPEGMQRESSQEAVEEEESFQQAQPFDLSASLQSSEKSQDESLVALLTDDMGKWALKDYLLQQMVSLRELLELQLAELPGRFKEEQEQHQHREEVRAQYDECELDEQPAFSLQHSATPRASQYETKKCELERQIKLLKCKEAELKTVNFKSFKCLPCDFLAELDQSESTQQQSSLNSASAPLTQEWKKRSHSRSQSPVEPEVKRQRYDGSITPDEIEESEDEEKKPDLEISGYSYWS